MPDNLWPMPVVVIRDAQRSMSLRSTPDDTQRWLDVAWDEVERCIEAVKVEPYAMHATLLRRLRAAADTYFDLFIWMSFRGNQEHLNAKVRASLDSIVADWTTISERARPRRWWVRAWRAWARGWNA